MDLGLSTRSEKPIGCKWIFKMNTDMEGNVQTYKERLVAKDFNQVHGIDYDKIFSPVTRESTIGSVRYLDKIETKSENLRFQT